MHRPDASPSATGGEALADSIAEKAAVEAGTVGEFRSQFERRANVIIGHDGASVSDASYVHSIEQRRHIIELATRGIENRRLQEQEDSVNGSNTIGGGTTGITHNSKRFTSLRTEGDIVAIRMTDAHEKAHGEAVQLHGHLSLPQLRGRDASRTHVLLHEGWAEYKGNLGIGKGAEHRREGQPGELYGEGQHLVLTLMRRTSAARVEKLMTGDGDLNRFQADLTMSRS